MKKILILVIGICSFGLANAQDDSFFTDPSLLKPREGSAFDLHYKHPDIAKIAQRLNAVMVDQPEILMAPDTKYKGAKGDDLKQLADVARMATIERLEAGGYAVTDEPGPNVVFLRWAISDLYLKKKKRSPLSFTPVGMVVHTTAQAAIRDLWKKIDIVELNFKVEVLDSVTGEILAAGVGRHGARKAKGQKEELVTWQQLDALFQTVGERLRCRMDNNKLPEGQKRQDCDVIVVEPETG